MYHQVQNISLLHRWLHFQHLLYILNLGFDTDSGEDKYFLLYSCTHIRWFRVGITIYYALLLLTMYCLCSCNWSLRDSYRKSCVTCYFLDNVSLANLKYLTDVYLYISQIRSLLNKVPRVPRKPKCPSAWAAYLSAKVPFQCPSASDAPVLECLKCLST